MKQFFFLMLMGIALTFAACNNDDNENEEASTGDPFYGRWEVYEAEGLFAEDNKGLIYEFAEDGEVRITGGFTSVGTYTRTDTDLNTTFGGVTVEWTYEMMDDEMILDNKGSEQTLYLRKM